MLHARMRGSPDTAASAWTALPALARARGRRDCPLAARQEAADEGRQARAGAEDGLPPGQGAAAAGGRAAEPDGADEALQAELQAAQRERKMLADEVQALTDELRSAQARLAPSPPWHAGVSGSSPKPGALPGLWLS